MIRLSYVMPAYNRASSLAAAAESVLAQLEAGDELIVVDDGSTDDTPERLIQLQKRWNGLLRVERQTNAGPGAARNRGIALASGDWIGFLDSDDELLPGAVALVRAAIARDPGAGFLCGGRVERVNGGAERRLAGRSVPADPLLAMESFLVTGRRSLGVGAVLARRDVALRTGFPPELPFAEDNVFFARALGSTRTISLVEPLYRYHLEPARVNERAQWRDFSVERMVDLMFDPAIVSPAVQPLKQRALAAAWLSVFRDLHRLGRDREARVFYKRAFERAPGLALRWRYLRKYLRGLVGLRHPDIRRPRA
ncbi:MAG TPA: glycosyltransferase [Kiloniellales bacterium]|nr:glycosyltransferase [Kiloniellales bacterium]